MGTLAFGFLTAWLAVVVYVAWIGVQQRRLSQRLQVVERLGAFVDEATRSHAA